MQKQRVVNLLRLCPYLTIQHAIISRAEEIVWYLVKSDYSLPSREFWRLMFSCLLKTAWIKQWQGGFERSHCEAWCCASSHHKSWLFWLIRKWERVGAWVKLRWVHLRSKPMFLFQAETSTTDKGCILTPFLRNLRKWRHFSALGDSACQVLFFMLSRPNCIPGVACS